MEKERICCVCRTKRVANELLRVARIKTPDGSFRYFIDTAGNANGRGCHICNSRECIEKCAKTRAVNRSYKTNIDQSVYSELLQHIK